MSVASFCPLAEGSTGVAEKNAALILSFWFFLFRIKTKEKEHPFGKNK
ncbi:hypothetical protein BN890_25980 [Bacteroides xylanisolvens SD CC 1b]|uniref:Uncharacterized protein n=1 Tax=Bacteroides xylanisolvens SD CC 1b TaxID=702447 RepID=W6PAU9_9BACE|nr:hypothetical protein BN890_25980 [Bacteroides xylanisolvens SD CC 1b]